MDFKRLKFLIDKLKDGKKEYFIEFFDLTKKGVFYIISKNLFQQAFVEDILQETYITFINSLHKISTNANPYSYLLVIAKNKAIDECRRNKLKNAKNLEDLETLESLINIENAQEQEILESIIDTYQENEINFPLLSHCKKMLLPEEFKILELTIIFGYKRVEVAKILHEPVSTVNYKYNAILKKIKKLYKEVYDD